MTAVVFWAMAQFDLINDTEETGQGGTVDVLIPLGLDQAYSYAVPAGLVLRPGDVVQVPLGPRETVGRFRDDVLERLRTTPTDAAGDAIRSLMAHHPERLILRRALIDVERAAADAVWRPIECEAVLATRA